MSRDSDGLPIPIQIVHRQTQQLHDVLFALANAAPADGIQIDLVDQPANNAVPRRLVAIDIVKRASGIEARLTAEAKPG